MDADRAVDKSEEAKQKIAAALLAVKAKAQGQNVGFDPFERKPKTNQVTILGTRG
jgi:hypothetical protein